MSRPTGPQNVSQSVFGDDRSISHESAQELKIVLDTDADGLRLVQAYVQYNINKDERISKLIIALLREIITLLHPMYYIFTKRSLVLVSCTKRRLTTFIHT